MQLFRHTYPSLSRQSLTRGLFYLWALWVLAGCQSTDIESSVIQQAPFALTDRLEAESNATDEKPLPPTAWLASFNDEQLQRWVEQAVEDNFTLTEARARVEAARQQRIGSRSNLWPTFDLELNQQRQKSNSDGSSYNNDSSISVDIAWEVDLWGKLANSRDAAEFRLQAEQSSYDATKLSLSAQVAKAWFELISANQLSNLLRERIANLTTNLDIIQSGYRQGINNALDVYLAQTDLAAEQNNLQQQAALEKNAVRQLQLLLGDYPSGSLKGLDPDSLSFPALAALEVEQLISDNVRHRPDIQASYLELLASDRELAVAHKNRFPSFRLTASSGDSSDELKNLLDSSSLAWNVFGGISQPLFSGGRLKALEQQQRAVVRQKEQQYLNALHTAFNEVEQSLTNEAALKQQLQSVLSAKSYAEAAEELAFEEYRQGLQTYTAVLEAQRRAFGAQNTVVSIRNQLLQNRISIYLALGGDYQ